MDRWCLVGGNFDAAAPFRRGSSDRPPPQSGDIGTGPEQGRLHGDAVIPGYGSHPVSAVLAVEPSPGKQYQTMSLQLK